MGRAGEAKEWRGKRGGTARDGARVVQGAPPREVLQPIWFATNDEYLACLVPDRPKVCNTCLSVCRGAQFSLHCGHDAMSTSISSCKDQHGLMNVVQDFALLKC